LNCCIVKRIRRKSIKKLAVKSLKIANLIVSGILDLAPDFGAGLLPAGLPSLSQGVVASLRIALGNVTMPLRTDAAKASRAATLKCDVRFHRII
jgi:hypothetical protein